MFPIKKLLVLFIDFYDAIEVWLKFDMLMKRIIELILRIISQ